MRVLKKFLLCSWCGYLFDEIVRRGSSVFHHVVTSLIVKVGLELFPALRLNLHRLPPAFRLS